MLLELNNLKKHFPAKSGFFGSSRDVVKAVDGINLRVQSQSNFSLVGESGCGKTTLARIILKLMEPDEGSIIFDGKDITNLSDKHMRPVRKHMQMVFQDPYSSLDPRFTIYRLLNEALILDNGQYRLARQKFERMRQILKAVGLDGDVLTRYPHEFSGGERQRIAIARSLMLNPKLLILDEAVSSLDVIIQKQLMNLLADLQKNFNLTYLFISHNLKVVKRISHTIAVMYKGKIVELAPAEQLFERPLHAYTKELLLAAMDYKAVQREEAIQINSDARLVDQGGGHFVLC